VDGACNNRRPSLLLVFPAAVGAVSAPVLAPEASGGSWCCRSRRLFIGRKRSSKKRNAKGVTELKWAAWENIYIHSSE